MALMLTTAIFVALIAAIPATLASVAALCAVVVSARRADSKLDQIHTLTNSTATEQQAKIEELQTIVKLLIDERGKTARKE